MGAAVTSPALSRLCEYLVPPDTRPSLSVHHATPEFALAHTPPGLHGRLRYMLHFTQLNCPLLRISTEFYPVVDVKIWPLLREGQLPALPHWHIDGDHRDPLHHPVWNLLWFRGADCSTEFKASDGTTYFAAEDTFHVYRRTAHRATPARSTGPRQLIRVTVSRHIHPKNQTFQAQNAEYLP